MKLKETNRPKLKLSRREASRSAEVVAVVSFVVDSVDVLLGQGIDPRQTGRGEDAVSPAGREQTLHEKPGNTLAHMHVETCTSVTHGDTCSHTHTLIQMHVHMYTCLYCVFVREESIRKTYYIN